MINQELTDYIRQQSGQGTSPENIKSGLLANGWTDSDIKEAYAHLSGKTATPINKKLIVIPVILLLLTGGGVFAFTSYTSKQKEVVSAIPDPVPVVVQSESVSPDTVQEVPPEIVNKPVSATPPETITVNKTPIIIKSGDFSLTVTKEDVTITESYDGATWSADSKNFYFSKYVDISLASTAMEKVGKEIFDRLMAGSPDLKGAPNVADFEKPLYKKLLIFAYNIETKKVKLLTAVDYRPCAFPVELYFASLMEPNKLQFQGCSDVYTLNLTNFQIEKAYNPDSNFYERSDRISPTFLTKSRSGEEKSRYLSPDRHAFVQIHEPLYGDDTYQAKSGFVPAPERIGVFRDVSIVLKDMDELWDLPSESAINNTSLHHPQYFLNPKLMQSPEEIEIKSRLDIK